PPAPVPYLCSIDPSAIDLRLSPNQREATLNAYGFNLSDKNVHAVVVHKDGSESHPGTGVFNVATEYMATFNMVNYHFKDDDRKVVFKLSNGGEKSVGIDQAPSCGGVGQACCENGRACDPGTGCENKKCVTCPAPFVAKTTELLRKSDEFDG